ncbi:MBL fold metallo-hydrolase [Stigmatella hybrida]|uniref:MBL fold metallo-hydrolase n=1 Tax=Stigmatella hybrida TaxID=394097 RepID=UPI001CDB21E3|nr:MBL fold metallo-hydrolase [Stigmatella hybrida]
MSKGSIFGGKAQGLRLERMQASPRFRDGTFQNTANVASGLKRGTAFSTMGEYFLGGQARTPPGLLPSESPLATWATPAGTGLRATWLGHSTVLLEIDGTRVLTDPVWGERASPSSFMGPKRFQPMPVRLSQLPRLDAVIISHDHYDHLDRPTLLELALTDVPFFTSLGVGAHLESWGIPPERITELDWWESAPIPQSELRITAAPSQHFSGRGLGDRNRTLWSSFAVQSPKHKVFFSGDTGLTPEYGEIRQRLGPFDLVMLEVGAYHPAWGDIHLGPENALKALELLGGGAFLPVHWGTFNLAIHAWDEPAETLVRLADTQRVQLVMPRAGAPVEPRRFECVEPWWRLSPAPQAAPPPLAEEVRRTG